MSIMFSVLSLFPEQVLSALDHSITGRAIAHEHIEMALVQIRDFAVNDYGQVDDAPYGGGRGMVMMCDPVYNAWRSVIGDDDTDVRTIYLSPAGKVFDQAMALSLSEEQRIVLICGHYEGVDTRVIEEIQAEEVSIGDFILTGGELAAAVIIDAVTRLIPGVLPDQEAWQLESFSDGLLEWPQYTRPRAWHSRTVPGVLLSGHQANIDRERSVLQLLETIRKKPALLKSRKIDLELWELLAERLADEAFEES